jgi:glycosyltransferase involved in cell wall biosynthesis
VVSVVVATPDVVGERMAGPGIRAFHLAEELRKHFDTTLIAKGSPRDALKTADVLIGQPARSFRRRRRGQRVIYDLFDPTLLELRELYGKHPTPRQRVHYLAEHWRLRRALTDGDALICATPQQRELYAKGAERLIEVPFGVEQNVPRAATRDNIVVWGGGTWEWLDPATAVQAIVRVNLTGTNAQLLFLGRSRPNADNAIRNVALDALLEGGKPYVSANEEWVPYRDRFATLSRSKVAIMLHRDTQEAKYSIRTRLFDAIAAGVPVVATAGGFAADLVERERLGIVVAPGDIDGVTDAIRKLLTDDVFHAACVLNLERVRPAFAWDIVTRPLVDLLNRWKQP